MEILANWKYLVTGFAAVILGYGIGHTFGTISGKNTGYGQCKAEQATDAIKDMNSGRTTRERTEKDVRKKQISDVDKSLSVNGWMRER